VQLRGFLNLSNLVLSLCAFLLIPVETYGDVQTEVCFTSCVGPGAGTQAFEVVDESGYRPYRYRLEQLLNADGEVIAEVKVDRADLAFDPIEWSPNLHLLDLIRQAASEEKYLCQEGSHRLYVSERDETAGCFRQAFNSNF